ncbi:hypothetical protein EOS93_10830 [Rhizobium sp. RMa-01]|uniref:hypothetical protein n=1 Tax=unclassified Rhizobium TaxID=2613769 RepID=UPI0008D8EAA8|nr:MULTISPECIES: hypothetical protein [unclassified Rhizobium]OHV26108.1 hypothetical protein BBJ66_05110 [Rhizobium sp. RSm-3]RVU11282.1 hypothetical protein EOS93_10830 [Rhizobium sp. RMa-01]
MQSVAAFRPRKSRLVARRARGCLDAARQPAKTSHPSKSHRRPILLSEEIGDLPHFGNQSIGF